MTDDRPIVPSFPAPLPPVFDSEAVQYRLAILAALGDVVESLARIETALSRQEQAIRELSARMRDRS